jgi:hypothetical protein
MCFVQTDGVVRKEPLTQRQTLVLLEGLYDLVLNIEQLRRDQPPEEDEEDEEAFTVWYAGYSSSRNRTDKFSGQRRTMILPSKYGRA